MINTLNSFMVNFMWVLIVYHLAIYHRYAGWWKSIAYVLIIPVLPLFIRRVLKEEELNAKDSILLKAELYMILVLLLSFLLSFSFAIVDVFDLLPFKVSKYDPKLPAVKVRVLLEGQPVSQTESRLLRKIELDMNYDFIKRSDMNNLGTQENIEMDYRELWSIYMEKVFLSSSGQEGTFFVQVKDADLPFVEIVLPRIAKRFEERLLDENNKTYIKTKEGRKKQYSIQVLDKWIPESNQKNDGQ